MSAEPTDAANTTNPEEPSTEVHEPTSEEQQTEVADAPATTEEPVTQADGEEPKDDEQPEAPPQDADTNAEKDTEGEPQQEDAKPIDEETKQESGESKEETADNAVVSEEKVDDTQEESKETDQEAPKVDEEDKSAEETGEELAKADEPAESAEPAEPAAPAEPREPTEPTESTEVAEPAEPIESAEPAEPSETVEPTETTGPTAPTETAEPSEPTAPIEVTESTEPTKPVESTEPADDSTNQPTDAPMTGTEETAPAATAEEVSESTEKTEVPSEQPGATEEPAASLANEPKEADAQPQEVEMTDAEPLKPEEPQQANGKLNLILLHGTSNQLVTDASANSISNDVMDMEVDMEMSDGAGTSPAPFPKPEPADSTADRPSSNDTPSSTTPAVPVFRQVKAEPKAPTPLSKLTQTHAIVIPSYAAWFSLTKIHEVEKRSLPEFFNQRNRSKTPEIYTKYRNFMVNTYRLNPAEYLTVTACRRNLIGDVCTIMRLHNFLDKWGLINYQVDVEALPANVVPPFTGHWNVLHDTPRGLFPFKFYKGVDDPEASKLPGGKTIEAAAAAAKASPTQSSAPATGATDENKAQSSASPQPKTESPKHGNAIDPGFGWTKKELLLLLEGVEKYNNDWTAIARHIGTKGKEESILKFLSLSIEDPYLKTASNGVANGSAIKQEDKDVKLGPLKYDTSNIPISQADNPVMSVVSFLAELVDPKVVAAAADRSIKAIKETVEAKPDDEEPSNTEDKEKSESSAPPRPLETVSDDFLEKASTVAFGTLGARADVVRGQTERQMYTNLFKLASQQLAKNDIKMKKFNQLEQVLEMERRELEREREEIFLDRLALHKKVKNVDELLSRALGQAQTQVQNGGSGDESSNLAVKATLDEAARVISDGAKLALNANTLVGGAIAATAEENGEDAAAATANGGAGPNGTGANATADVQPISVELPQTYKFWNI